LNSTMVDYSRELHDLLLPRFSRPDVERLLFSMKDLVLAAGDVLFSVNESGDKLFFVVKGRLAVQKKTGFDKRVQVVALLDPGAPVAERAILRDHIHGATLLAVKDSKLLSFSRVLFENMKKEQPLLAVSLLEWLMDRVTLRLRKNSDRLSHIL